MEDGSGALAFRDIEVFDGVGFTSGQTVVVQHGRIAAVGPGAPPPGCRLIEGEERTLLPGFIDCHVHLGLVRPARVLAGGVTTVRDLGWPEPKIFSLADRLDADTAAGPRLLAAGPMLTAPGGYPVRAGWGPKGTGREVASADEGIEAVQALAARGACVIKVAQEPRAGPTLASPVLAAIVGAAHVEGLTVTSHLGSLAQLEVALDAGVDELAHGLWSNEAIPAGVIDRMVDVGMVVVPTLHIDPSAPRLDNLRRFLEAGGEVVYGTDMGNSGPPLGIDTEELSLMVRAGMPLAGVLAAATSRAGEHVGLPAKGRIVPGAVADLVLVAGSPRQSLSVLDAPLLVVREGNTGGRS